MYRTFQNSLTSPYGTGIVFLSLFCLFFFKYEDVSYNTIVIPVTYRVYNVTCYTLSMTGVTYNVSTVLYVTAYYGFWLLFLIIFNFCYIHLHRNIFHFATNLYVHVFVLIVNVQCQKI